MRPPCHPPSMLPHGPRGGWGDAHLHSGTPTTAKAGMSTDTQQNTKKKGVTPGSGKRASAGAAEHQGTQAEVEHTFP